MKKNILLIGGSYGIGRAIIEQMNDSCNLYVAARTNENLEPLNVNYIPFDATLDNLDLEMLPEELHGFVYCPGSINLKPFKMTSLELFEEDMQINFFSLVKVVKTIMPRLSNGASLVFFSTVAVAKGMSFHSSIAASKGAVEGFGKSMAAEHAPKLRVNIVAPSLVDTPLAKRLLNNDRKKEANAERHPMKRVGKATDIANIVVFLLGEKSSWITGQVIGVDGGSSTLNLN